MGKTSFVVTETGNDLGYNITSYFPKEIENIFFEILSSSEPIVVGTIYENFFKKSISCNSCN